MGEGARPKGSGVNSGLFSSVQLKSTSGSCQRGGHSVGDLASVSAGDEGRLMVSRVILVQVDCNQDRDGSTRSSHGLIGIVMASGVAAAGVWEIGRAHV